MFDYKNLDIHKLSLDNNFSITIKDMCWDSLFDYNIWLGYDGYNFNIVDRDYKIILFDTKDKNWETFKYKVKEYFEGEWNNVGL